MLARIETMMIKHEGDLWLTADMDVLIEMHVYGHAVLL
jgi:hypothetical protein